MFDLKKSTFALLLSVTFEQEVSKADLSAVSDTLISTLLSLNTCHIRFPHPTFLSITFFRVP